MTTPAPAPDPHEHLRSVDAQPDPAGLIDYLQQRLTEAQTHAANLTGSVRSLADQLVAERIKNHDLEVEVATLRADPAKE